MRIYKGMMAKSGKNAHFDGIEEVVSITGNSVTIKMNGQYTHVIGIKEYTSWFSTGWREVYPGFSEYLKQCEL